MFPAGCPSPLLLCSTACISSFTSSIAALIHPRQVLRSCTCLRQLEYILHPQSHHSTAFLCPPPERLPPVGLHTSRHLGIRISSIRATYPNHLSLLISIASTSSWGGFSVRSRHSGTYSIPSGCMHSNPSCVWMFCRMSAERVRRPRDPPIYSSF